MASPCLFFGQFKHLNRQKTACSLLKKQNKRQKLIIGLLSLQSMVKIKYNNMKISKKQITVAVVARRSTLRSANKHSPQDNNITAGSSDEKAIQQIHKQFDNLQSINASKSTNPLQQDLKPIQLQHNEPTPSYIRTRRSKLLHFAKLQNHNVDQQPVTKQSLDEIKPVSPTPIVEQVKTQQKQPLQQLDKFLTPVKHDSKNSKIEQSHAFKVSRKSYRKNRRNKIIQVPFRKFQDNFEQKIVILINKICHKRCAEKDIQFLIEKIQKISNKDLYNPYVISGIKTILNLLQKSNQGQQSFSKLNTQISKLSTRILQELGKMDDYENVLVQQKKEMIEQLKPKFIKKIYKMLLQTNKCGFKQARQKSFKVSQQFFSHYNNYTNEDDLLSFFKEQKFLTY